VFNKNAGHVGDRGNGNQTGIAAFAEPTAMASLQTQLWQQGHGEPPMVFLGREYATWPDRAPVAPSRGLEVWFGRPIAVDETPRVHHVSDDADQTIVVLGQEKANTPGPRDTMRTLIATALPGLAGGEVVVLDGEGSDADPWFNDLEKVVRDQGVGFTRVTAFDAARWLLNDGKTRVADRSARTPMLLVGLSVQRLRDLDLEEVSDDDDGFSLEDRNARTVLQDVAKRGAQSNMYFFGSWNSLRTLENDLGAYGTGVAVYLTVDLGLEDLRSIAGPAVQRVDGSPRVGVFDRSSGDKLEVVVPYRTDTVPNWEGI
jgi:hypothetical protein